jgi:lysophospholipase L1-like esterase
MAWQSQGRETQAPASFLTRTRPIPSQIVQTLIAFQSSAWKSVGEQGNRSACRIVAETADRGFSPWGSPRDGCRRDGLPSGTADRSVPHPGAAPGRGEKQIVRKILNILAFSAILWCGSGIVARAQSQTPAAGVKASECACAAAVPAKDDYWKKHDEQVLRDFGWLERFREANLALAAPKANENRVVFMGDSITELWHFTGADGSFNGKPYVNRGISGQTTPQMLVRFRQDVIALRPKVVVLLAGTNDIAGNTGPMTLEQTEDNLASMAELAAAHGIRVVLCSVLPAFDYPWKPGLEPAPRILKINTWLRNYAAQKGFVYVDFHTAMKDSRNGLPATLSGDGVHPQPAGYAVMTPLVEAGIAAALAR